MEIISLPFYIVLPPMFTSLNNIFFLFEKNPWVDQYIFLCIFFISLSIIFEVKPYSLCGLNKICKYIYISNLLGIWLVCSSEVSLYEPSNVHWQVFFWKAYKWVGSMGRRMCISSTLVWMPNCSLKYLYQFILLRAMDDCPSCSTSFSTLVIFWSSIFFYQFAKLNGVWLI